MISGAVIGDDTDVITNVVSIFLSGPGSAPQTLLVIDGAVRASRRRLTRA